MKKLLLSLLFTLCFILSSKAQTEGWQQMKSLNDDIATRHRSQMGILQDLTVAANTIYFWKIITKDAKGNKSDSGLYQFKTN